MKELSTFHLPDIDGQTLSDISFKIPSHDQSFLAKAHKARRHCSSQHYLAYNLKDKMGELHPSFTLFVKVTELVSGNSEENLLIIVNKIEKKVMKRLEEEASCAKDL